MYFRSSGLRACLHGGGGPHVSEVTRFGERRLSPDYSSSCTVLFHPLIVEDVLPVLLQQLPFVPPEDSPSLESNCFFF